MKLSFALPVFLGLFTTLVAPRAAAFGTDLIVATAAGANVNSFPHPSNTPVTSLIAGAGVLARSFTFGPDGYIYLADSVTNTVKRFYPDGTADCSFAWPTIAGFAPEDILFDPTDGSMLVSSPPTGQVITMNVSNGAFGNLFTPHANGLGQPGHMVFHPSTGQLLVADIAGDKVWAFCNTGGGTELCTFIGTAVGGLDRPERMVWWNGELYIVSALSNEVLRFDQAGAYRDVIAPKGTEVPAVTSIKGLAIRSNSDIYIGDNSNTRILRYTATPNVVNSSAFHSIFAAGLDTIELRFRIQQRATFPLAGGELVTTFCPDLVAPGVPNPAGYCVKVVDPRGNGPIGRNWLAPMFSNEDAANPADVWSTANLGTVFGCCIDGKGNIFVASTSAYGLFPPTTYPAGPGAVFKIDRVTGAISVWLTTIPVPSILTASAPGLTGLPNTGPGLGDICYDHDYDQFFVSNLEDGKIYRVQDTGATGVVLDAFDPFDNDDTTDATAGFPVLGERVYAVHKLNARILLWSTWLGDSARPVTAWPALYPPLPGGDVANNAVFRSFVNPNSWGGVNLFKVMPLFAGGTSNPVTDITDSEPGPGLPTGSRILCAERTFIGDYGAINLGASAHKARVLEYLEASGFPASGAPFYVGTPGTPPTNCAGGIIYDGSDNVWSTGDALLVGTCKLAYGLQRIPTTGNAFSPETAQSYIIDLDHLTEYYDKSQPGDVEIAGYYPFPPRPFPYVCAGDIYASCPCGTTGALSMGCPSSSNPDGALLSGTGLASVSADTVVLDAQVSPNTPVLFFQGNALMNGIQGVPFGDGQLCVGGTITRLGVRFSGVTGAASLPGFGDLPLSILGGIQPGSGWRYYQAWYRDAAPGFCAASTFNLSSAIGVEWTP